ncbi:MAG TPA: VRR-NUC domain-containing protein [Kofleriaceae bacterium]
MTETQLMLQIRDALLATDKLLLWRNNSGKLADARGRWVTFGLGVGSADLVGILRGSGRFVAWEVKTRAVRVSPEQRAWHYAVTNAGGVVFVARSVEEALGQLRSLFA